MKKEILLKRKKTLLELKAYKNQLSLLMFEDFFFKWETIKFRIFLSLGFFKLKAPESNIPCSFVTDCLLGVNREIAIAISSDFSSAILSTHKDNSESYCKYSS